NPATPPQSIQDQTRWANTGLCQQCNRAADCWTGCFSRSNHNAHRLDVRSHEESVTYSKNRCAIDHHAVKQLCSLSNQLPEEWTGKNLSRIRRTSSAREDRKLDSRRRKNFPSKPNVLVDKLDFPGGNHARCRNQVHFTDQTIRP